VTLVSGPTALPSPPGVRTIPTITAADMARVLAEEFQRATVLVMAAAVADYRPAKPLARKLKKVETSMALRLERTTDIVSTLAARKGRRLVVGFAAETHDVVTEARRKLATKRLDLIVANDVTAEGAGFGTDTNIVRLLDGRGLDASLEKMAKDEVAGRILDWVVARRAQGPKVALRRVR